MAKRRDRDGTIILSKATRLSGHTPRTGERSAPGAGQADATTIAPADRALDPWDPAPTDALGESRDSAPAGERATPGAGSEKTAMDDPPYIGYPGGSRKAVKQTKWGTGHYGTKRTFSSSGPNQST